MHSRPQLLRFSLEILNAHNDLRALHEIGPVILSEKVYFQIHKKTLKISHQLNNEAQKLAEEMVQSNKVTPAVRDLQGVNILGSWSLTDIAVVRLRQRHLTIFLSFLEPR